MKKVLSATIGLLAISAVPAAAADLPVKARPMVPVVTAYNWTGCHIGGNVGGKWARTSGTADVAGTAIPGPNGAPGTVLIGQGDSSSIIAGGQVGCDYQPVGSNWVFGIEGDFDWHRLSRTTALVGAQPFPFVAGDIYDWRSDWQASIRGRIGYAFDRVMIYATGGGAFTNVIVGSNYIALTTAGVNFPAAVGSSEKTIAGWTFGGGLEYAFVNNWSVGIEGRYSWYGTHRFSGPALATFFTPANGGTFTFASTSQSVKLETFEVMAKLNWKFM